MTEQTLFLCASLVTQGFMQSEEIDGMEERVIHMSDGRDGHFVKGRGAVKSQCFKPQGNGAAPSCVLFAFLNGVLNT